MLSLAINLVSLQFHCSSNTNFIQDSTCLPLYNIIFIDFPLFLSGMAWRVELAFPRTDLLRRLTNPRYVTMDTNGCRDAYFTPQFINRLRFDGSARRSPFPLSTYFSQKSSCCICMLGTFVIFLRIRPHTLKLVQCFVILKIVLSWWPRENDTTGRKWAHLLKLKRSSATHLERSLLLSTYLAPLTAQRCILVIYWCLPPADHHTIAPLLFVYLFILSNVSYRAQPLYHFHWDFNKTQDRDGVIWDIENFKNIY